MSGAVVVVQLTPFCDDGSLDLEALRENAAFLVERGRRLVLTPAGSTGEFYAMTDEEWRRVVKTVVDEADGKVPVVVGAGHSGTIPAVERARYAEDVGADGVVVLPYYHVPEEEGLYLHYKAIAERIDIGLIICNRTCSRYTYGPA